MLRRTEKGIGVLYVFRPLPIGLVFEDEDLLVKANTHYNRVVGLFVSACLLHIAFTNFHSNKPDWWYIASYIGLALAIPFCYLIIYLLMPLRVLYDEEKHGAIQHPTEKT